MKRKVRKRLKMVEEGIQEEITKWLGGVRYGKELEMEKMSNMQRNVKKC